jgi:hypothetical protein
MINLIENKTTMHNTGLAKVAVQCSADTFVVNQTLVLRINICGENRHLRQARKRYFFKKKLFQINQSINQRHFLQQKRSVHVLANSLSDFVIKAYFIQQNR